MAWIFGLACACLYEPAPRSRADAAQAIAQALCARAQMCGDAVPTDACVANVLEQLCGEGYDCGDGAADLAALDTCLVAVPAMLCVDAPDTGQGNPPATCRDALVAPR